MLREAGLEPRTAALLLPSIPAWSRESRGLGMLWRGGGGGGGGHGSAGLVPLILPVPQNRHCRGSLPSQSPPEHLWISSANISCSAGLFAPRQHTGNLSGCFNTSRANSVWLFKRKKANTSSTKRQS